MNEEYGLAHKHTSVFNDGFKIGGFEMLILENHQKTTGNILALRSVPVFKLERGFYSRPFAWDVGPLRKLTITRLHLELLPWLWRSK